MSQRGTKFLRNWIKKNVRAVSYQPLYDRRAKVLAEQCAADARKMKVSVEEIEVEVGDLADCILKAMNQASSHQASGRESNGAAPATR